MSQPTAEAHRRLTRLAALGVIIQSVVVLVAGVIIAVVTQWRIGLVGASLAPILVGAGILRLHVVVLKDAKTKKAHEQSAQLACEAAGAIRTVAALTREDHAWNVYRCVAARALGLRLTTSAGARSTSPSASRTGSPYGATCSTALAKDASSGRCA